MTTVTHSTHIDLDPETAVAAAAAAATHRRVRLAARAGEYNPRACQAIRGQPLGVTSRSRGPGS